MNPSAILALIGDLYSQLAALREENAALRDQLAAKPD
jgi:hypothetical protein